MTTKSFLSDPEHWRTRAEDARSLAQDIKDANTKKALLQIADEYPPTCSPGRRLGPTASTEALRKTGQGFIQVVIQTLLFDCRHPA
jgi:hypothetical protein